VKIAIIGTGAIGCFFSAILKKGGLEAVLVGRDRETVSAIRSRGVIVEEEGTTESVKVPAFLDAAEAGPAEIVILAVKAYDTVSAIPSVKTLLADGGVALTFQNGIGNEETLAETLGPDRVLLGTTAHGSTVVAPGHVRHAGTGETLLGEMSGVVTKRAERVAEHLTSGGVVTRAVENAPGYVWLKLIINDAINPLTAILNFRNVALIDLPGAPAVMEKAVSEAEAVTRVRGIVIPCEDMMEKVRQVCRATGGNISSMLQDVRAGRRTEVDYINGAVVRLGAEAGIPTPCNEFLTAMMKGIEGRPELPPEKRPD
jgi:2-dehydropantoate 2-reductase